MLEKDESIPTTVVDSTDIETEADEGIKALESQDIKDQGIGIPRSHIKNIFKKFYRIEDSLSAKTKGHGLGLSIVQGLMQLNKGTIKVKSEKTSGSTFTCYFPKYYRDSSDSITKMSKNSNSSGSTQRNNHLSTETIV